MIKWRKSYNQKDDSINPSPFQLFKRRSSSLRNIQSQLQTSTTEISPFSLPNGVALEEIFKVDLGYVRGPKVKPYMLPQYQTSHKVLQAEDLCYICEEPLLTVLENEKAISMNCGDNVHGECFNMIIDHQAKSLPKSTEKIKLPICRGKLCYAANSNASMSPTDADIEDKAITKILLYQNRKLRTSLRTSRSESGSGSGSGGSEYSTPSLFSSLAEMSSLSEVCPISKNDTSSGHHSRVQPGSEYLLHSPNMMPRPASPNPTINSVNTMSMRISSNKDVSLETLTNRYLQYLLDHCTGFHLNTLLQCGTLRLVDKLLVSISVDEVRSERTCYLFQNNLIIWDEESDITRQFPLQSVSFTILRLSILKIRIAPNIGIWLSSEHQSIIEKWAISLTDPDFEFPPDLLTSTVSIAGHEAHLDILDTSIDLISPLSMSFPRSSLFKPPQFNYLITEAIDEEDVSSLYSDAININPLQHQSFLESNHIASISSTVSKFNSDFELKDSLDSESDSDSDSDIDSDEEEIAKYATEPSPTANPGWTDLLLQLEGEITRSRASNALLS